MQYHITLLESEEGWWSVTCPALPGCHSQGATREEAIENIKVAIREWQLLDSLDCAASQLDAGNGVPLEKVQVLVREWASK